VITGALGVGLLAGMLGGCSQVDRLVGPDAPATPAPPAPATPAPAVPPAVPTADTVRSTGTAVEVDGTVVLHVLAVDGGTQVRADTTDSGTELTLDPGDPSARVDVLLAPPAGATLAPQDDDSVVVLAADGGFLGGAGRPLSGPGAEPTGLTPQPDGALRFGGTGPVTTQVGARAVAGTDWGEREGGRSLAVEPTSWARTAGLAGEVGAWTELVRAVPEADTQVMHDQLTCHALGAPDKRTWNLEPWRPDVGLLMTLAASCNAT
jgi:hypothetical protein